MSSSGNVLVKEGCRCVFVDDAREICDVFRGEYRNVGAVERGIQVVDVETYKDGRSDACGMGMREYCRICFALGIEKFKG